MILKKGGNVNAINHAGKTPLDIATIAKSPALVRLLERHGAERKATSAKDPRALCGYRLFRDCLMAKLSGMLTSAPGTP